MYYFIVFLILYIIEVLFAFFLSMKIKKIQNKKCYLIKQLKTLQDQIKQAEKNFNKINESISKNNLQKEKLTNYIKDLQYLYEYNKKLIKNKLDISIEESLQRATQYTQQLENSYNIVKKEYNQKVFLIQDELMKTTKELEQTKSQLSAGAAALIRQKEKQDKINFYKLSLSEKQQKDIKKLQLWKQELVDPTILSKLIWTDYFQKQTSQLCNRILGTEKVCGIYKITDLITKQVYIGQSVDISRRWKDHIRYGLGINAPSTNALYKAMKKDGITEFTFQLLQKCSNEKLNEREKFWIQIYSSNKYGMNSTSGGS